MFCFNYKSKTEREFEVSFNGILWMFIIKAVTFMNEMKGLTSLFFYDLPNV